MKKLAIVGSSGRMGTELIALAPEFKFEFTQGIGRAQRIADLDSGKIDVVIDFSLPDATDEVVKWCRANKKPLVSGVTGISAKQREAFAQKDVAMLWAPNMSLGVAVLSRMIAEFRGLKDFEFQIEEFHHKRKKDKPSGTALLLQERLEEATGKTEPAPLAIRGGGIVGLHRVWAMGEEETITLEHNALNRRVFARGALTAAQWLVGQKPGLYTLNDVLSS